MKTTQDVHATPASLKKKLKGTVDERLVGSDPIDKKTFDLRIATVIAFYPKEDKCMVRMRNTGNLIIADLSHNIISHNINVGFTPDGMKYKCTKTGYDAIKPNDIYTCVVFAIGGDFDHGGAVILNFITMSDSTFPDNPEPGSYLIQNQDSILEVGEDIISFKADKVLINGQEIEIIDVESLREDVDKINDKLAKLDLDTIINTVKNELLERDHPVGSPYFTFIVSDNPNNRFPGTEWVRVEENTYLVSAGDGINALQVLGSNSQSVRIDDQHYHEQNVGLPLSFAEIDGNTGTAPSTVVNPAHKSATTARADRLSVNGFIRNTRNSGTQSNTQTFDNRPKSIAIYMWRRTA